MGKVKNIELWEHLLLIFIISYFKTYVLVFIRPCNFDPKTGAHHLLFHKQFPFTSSTHRLSTQQYLYMWEIMRQSVQGSARMRTITLRGWVQVSWWLPQEQQNWILWKNSRMSMYQGREDIRCELSFFLLIFFTLSFF